jgi:hypothetical protein
LISRKLKAHGWEGIPLVAFDTVALSV